MMLLDCSSYLMRVLFSAVFVILVQRISAGRDKQLYCGACMAMVEEIEILINRVDKKKMIEVGSFRINPDGSQGLRQVPYARSDIHLTDILEKICSAMEIYGMTTDGEGATHYIRQTSFDGRKISSKYIQKNEDITRSLLYACENILEDHEDLIIKLFKVHASFEETATKLCHETEEFCQPGNFTAKLLAQGRAAMASMREKAEEPESMEEDDYEEDEEEVEEVDADEVDGQLPVEETEDTETPEKQEL